MSFYGKMTHYEFTTIRGLRIKQLEDGFPPFTDDVEDGDTFADIFEKEVREKHLPFILVRQLTNGKVVKVKASDLEIISDIKM